jgi:hypothetical protein
MAYEQRKLARGGAEYAKETAKAFFLRVLRASA